MGQPINLDFLQMSSIIKIGRQISSFLGDIRNDEYKISFKYLKNCNRILDVGCGSGTFISLSPSTIEGIDINVENVEYCNSKGLKSVTGDCRQIPFEDSTFDGVHFSHVLQVMSPDDAVKTIRELARVVKPGGLIVITTLNWFPRFFRHPENVRAYPPDAIRKLFNSIYEASSPMYPSMPKLRQSYIWLRRPPLFELSSPAFHDLNRLFGIINLLQYRLFIRKYWTFDAYVSCLVRDS